MSRTHSRKDKRRSCVINTLTYFLKTVYPARFPRKHTHEIQLMYSKRMKIPVSAELGRFPSRYTVLDTCYRMEWLFLLGRNTCHHVAPANSRGHPATAASDTWFMLYRIRPRMGESTLNVGKLRYAILKQLIDLYNF